MTFRVLFDVDTGIDDSLALLYLLGRDDVQIEAITCTAGNVPARQVAANNLAWLDLVGARAIPVCLGAPVPVVAPLMTTEDTHGPGGVGYADLPAPHRGLDPRHSVDMWVDTVRENPGQIIGIVTGPLTNIALALRKEPQLPHLLRRLYIMGGSFDYPGNTTPVSEWNIAVDPESAEMVFTGFAGLPLDKAPVIFGLNATENIALKPHHLIELARQLGDEITIGPFDMPGTLSDAKHPLVRHLVDAVRFYFEFHESQQEGYLAHMHDPFVVAAALDPTLYEAKPAGVHVELGGLYARGQTIADWRGHWPAAGKLQIVQTVQTERFFTELFQRVVHLGKTMLKSQDH